MMVSSGRSPTVAFSFVSNRFAVVLTFSTPKTIQPKLPEGLSSQDCTSTTICGFSAELHV